MSQSRVDSKLIDATKAGDLRQVQQTLGTELSRYQPSKEAINKALASAVHRNHVNIAKELLSHDAEADQIMKAALNISLLQYAVYHGNTDMVAALIPYVKNGDHLSNEGRTALHYAIESADSNLEIFEMLIERGASHNLRKEDLKGHVPSSQIGTMLKSCNIDMARIFFNKRPNALAEFMLVQPNIISYICKDTNPWLEKNRIEDMLKFLITEVPTIFIVNNKILDQHHFDEITADMDRRNLDINLIKLCKSRVCLSAFWLELLETPKEFIKVKLHRCLDNALSTLNKHDADDFYKMLAEDIVMILQNKAGVIDKNRFMEIFHKLLAIFITAPDGKLCYKLANTLEHACQHLLRSDNHNEAEMLCKLTLLTYLHASSCSNEDVSWKIVSLMKALLPETRFFELAGQDEALLNNFIEAHHAVITPFIQQLKQFYMTTFKIRVSSGQMSPFSKIESLLKNNELAIAQKDARDAQAEIAWLNMQLCEARIELAHTNMHLASARDTNAHLLEQKSALESALFTTRLQNKALLAQQEDVSSPEHSPVKQRKKKTAARKQHRDDGREDERPALPLKFRFTLHEEKKAAKDSEKAAKASAAKKSRK